MSKKSSGVEWTMSDAPGEDELSSPAAPPPAPAPRSSRWMVWVGLVVVLALGLGALGLHPALTRRRVEQALQQTVAAEEEAALSGDVAAYTAYVDPRRTDLIKVAAQLARSGQAAPLPIRLLQAATEPGRLQSSEMITYDMARVEVARDFTAPGGAKVTFVLPQFYRYTGSEWQRSVPPDLFWGEAREYAGTYLTLNYFAVDAAFAEELGPYLDGVLAQTCANWACPADFAFDLTLSSSVPPAHAGALPGLATSLPADAPLLFSVLLANGNPTRALDLTMPSPQVVGQPANAGAANLLKRAIGLEVLSQAAKNLAVTSGNQFPARNAFLYALVVRQAARLGLESEGVAGVRTVDTAMYPNYMWDWQYFQGGPLPALRGALATVNELLHEQPPEVESQLFLALRNAFELESWLSRGLSIPLEDARLRLQEAITRTLQLEVLASGHYDFALSCPAGPVVFSRGNSELTHILSGRIPDNWVGGWSPDGERLVMFLNGQYAVVDFDTASLDWLPGATDEYFIYPRAWASSDLLVKSLYAREAQGSQGDTQFSLTFLDVAEPARKFPTVDGLQDYVLSPDGSTAAVIRPAGAPSFGGVIILMPPQGGWATTVESGQAPTWSPDGRSLVYFQGPNEATRTIQSLRIHDREAGASHELLNIADLGLERWPTAGQLAWSPSGEHIAFVLTGNSPEVGRLGLIRPDGSGLTVVLDNLFAGSPPRFSADGEYLLFSQFDAGTFLVEVATGERINLAPARGVMTFDWSPSGHELAVLRPDGLFLFAEPGDLDAVPEKLVDAPGCSNLAWNPLP